MSGLTRVEAFASQWYGHRRALFEVTLTTVNWNQLSEIFEAHSFILMLLDLGGDWLDTAENRNR